MTEVVNPTNFPSTAALQVIVELIRAGQLTVGAQGEEAKTIIETHKQLAAYFNPRKPVEK